LNGYRHRRSYLKFADPFNDRYNQRGGRMRITQSSTAPCERMVIWRPS